jgi:hypothetical protein
MLKTNLTQNHKIMLKIYPGLFSDLVKGNKALEVLALHQNQPPLYILPLFVTIINNL